VIELLFLVACSGSAPVAEAPPPPVVEPRKHAVVLVIDTLRADAVVKADTPALDAIAARGDVVAHAVSAGTWTVPSVTSMFTGMMVRQHGWDLPSAQMGKYPPLPAVPTVAEVLHDAGFVTAGLYSNPYLAEPIGFDRGFDRWTRIADKSAAAKVKKELEGWNDGKRHFLYVHILGPHSALKPSDAAMAKWHVDPQFIDPRIGFDVGAAKRNQVPGVRDAYIAAYHGMVEDTDAIVGEIDAALAPYRDDTVLIVTSDHGELLGEHEQFGHGSFVWNQLTDIPMMAVGAGDLPDRMSNASVPDLVTTSLGVKHAWEVPRTYTGPMVSQREGKVAFSADGKLRGVWDPAGGAARVFDIVADPAETTPIADQVAPLQTALDAWNATTPAGKPGEGQIELAPETIEELRQLGYVH
jgi:arylsulfatase A-like enzyme